jgi:uncharacterized membrane protein YkoI
MSDKDMSGNDMSDNDMSANKRATARRRNQRLAGAFGLLLAGAMAGGLLAATSSASAADTTTSVVAATAAPTAPADRGRSVRPGETALTGADAEKAKAAALKAVPGGTVDRVETDADGATYEVHVTKADGSRVTVKLDKSFKVTSIEDGCGPGGPGGRGGADRTRPTGGTAPTASGAAV